MASLNTLNEIKSVGSNDGRVAIIMRTKDRPILLPRAFASVLSQTHENWHLYLVNDGGRRDDLEKIVKLKENVFRGRITVIHHEKSLGMEFASNSALKQAEGEFLIVHDDDDAWHPQFLEKTVRFLKDPLNSIFAGVVTNAYVIKEEIKDDVVIEKEKFEWGSWQAGIDFSQMISRNFFPPICLLIRKSVSNDVGEFSNTASVLGDWDYNIRILMIGDIGAIPERLAYYHTRITTSEDIYGNTTVTESGLKLHEKYDVLFRNRNLRGALNTNPEMMGVVQALGRQIDESKKEIVLNLNNQFGHLHNQVVNLNHQVVNLNRQIDLVHARLTLLEEAVVKRDLIHRFLTPVRWVRSITRRIIAKLSKKVEAE